MSKRAPKGAPTDLNVWVLGNFLDKHGRDIPARVEPTSAPHIRRCASAGLIEAIPGDIHHLRITDAGVKAIEDARAWAAARAAAAKLRR